MHDTNFSGSAISRKHEIKEHLRDIDEQVKRSKIGRQLKQLKDIEDAKKNKMKNILDPHNDENILLCVQRWYNSSESKKLELDMCEIWRKTMESKEKKISNRDFDKFASYVYLELALNDKSRPGCYSFSNSDFISKKAVWIPDDFDGDDYEALPAGWQLYKPPFEGAVPSRFEINLSGDIIGQKNHRKETVTINQRCSDLMYKLR